MPNALAWAAGVQEKGLKEGRPLAFWQEADALDVGVKDIARVRLCLIEEMPSVPDRLLYTATREAGLLGPGTHGLTLGHAVFILRSHAGQRQLLRHELRHVAQYETAGGLEVFLSVYLEQVARFGHAQAPLEVDARRHEVRKRPKVGK